MVGNDERSTGKSVYGPRNWVREMIEGVCWID